jgi:hypothetical protein
MPVIGAGQRRILSAFGFVMREGAMFRIRRFGVIRTANVVAFFYAVIIVVIVIPIGLIVAIALPNSGSVVGNAGGLAGNAAGLGIIFFGLLAAVFYAILGWIFTALACLLYNFAAGMIGGIEIQLEAVQPPPPSAVWTGTQTPPAAPPAAPPPAAPTT